MNPSHKLTQILLGLAALIALCAIAFAQHSEVQVSDQKSGSILVYPYYASGAAGSGSGDTRITISNIGPVPGFVGPGDGSAATPQTVAVHLFFLDSSCNQADTFVCLTPNASLSFKASDYDPLTTRGALYAVVVDDQGFPIAYNGLIGNAFVNYTDTAGRLYRGNYGAEAFTGVGIQLVPGNNNFYTGWSGTGGGIGFGVSPLTPVDNILLLFDQSPGLPFMAGYDGAPTRFAVEIQSPLDATDQTIVMAGLAGTFGGAFGGTAQVGVGTVINGNEKPFGSFTGLGGGCNSLNILTAQFPRVPLGLNGIIPSGQVGTIQFNVQGAVGLLMTPLQVGQKTNAWAGIRTLHKTAVLSNAGGNQTQGIRMPRLIPTC